MSPNYHEQEHLFQATEAVLLLQPSPHWKPMRTRRTLISSPPRSSAPRSACWKSGGGCGQQSLPCPVCCNERTLTAERTGEPEKEGVSLALTVSFGPSAV